MRHGEVRQADVNPNSQTAVFRGHNKRIVLVSAEDNNLRARPTVTAIPRTTTPNLLPAAVASPRGEAQCDEDAKLDCWQLLRVPRQNIRSRFGSLHLTTQVKVRETIHDCLADELSLPLRRSFSSQRRNHNSVERGTVGYLSAPGLMASTTVPVVVVSNTFANARSRVMSIVTVSSLDEEESSSKGSVEICIPNQGQFEVLEETVRAIDVHVFHPLLDSQRKPVRLSPTTVDMIVASIFNYITIGADG